VRCRATSAPPLPPGCCCCSVPLPALLARRGRQGGRGLFVFARNRRELVNSIVGNSAGPRSARQPLATDRHMPSADISAPGLSGTARARGGRSPAKMRSAQSRVPQIGRKGCPPLDRPAARLQSTRQSPRRCLTRSPRERMRGRAPGAPVREHHCDRNSDQGDTIPTMMPGANTFSITAPIISQSPKNSHLRPAPPRAVSCC
jgi:hypothetical protein